MSRRQVVRRQIQGALLAAAALMLAPQAATAQCRPNCRGYEQYQPCPRCQPYQPEYAPHRPGDLPEPGKEKEGAKQPPEGERPERPERQPEQPEQPNLQGADTAPSVAQAEGYSSSNSSILGRVDQNNRFNLFDSMSAMPQNRVWVTYLPQKRYHTGVDVPGSLDSSLDPSDVSFTPNPALLHERLSADLYRFGAELIIHPGVSVAVQGQFSQINGNEGGFDDVFTNPQVMLKAVLACDCCSILSGTFGVQPDIGTDDSLHPGINETSWRLYPGMLYFRDLGDGWFMQDGIQFGIPVESNQITTFDWAVSFGNWIYRDPCLDSSSRCCCCCQRPTVLGVIAQVEFFGKHVLGDDRIHDLFGVHNLAFEEDRTVVDTTAGIQVLLDGGCWVSVAASIPITSGDVKEVEGIVTVGHHW